MITVPPRIRELIQQVSATRDLPLTRDLALIGARIVLAWVFIYHGAYTLFGWFGGAGVHQASIFYASTAHLRPGLLFAVLGGSIEFFGGIAVGLGVLGRLAGAGLVGDMVMAMITVTFANGIASPSGQAPPPGGGYELNLALAGVAFVVAMLGTGRYSLDVVIRNYLTRRSGTGSGVWATPGPAGVHPATTGSPRPPG